jgi:hypothetical protein
MNEVKLDLMRRRFLTKSRSVVSRRERLNQSSAVSYKLPSYNSKSSGTRGRIYSDIKWRF